MREGLLRNPYQSRHFAPLINADRCNRRVHRYFANVKIPHFPCWARDLKVWQGFSAMHRPARASRGQKTTVNKAVAVTPPGEVEVAGPPLSDTPKLMLPGRCAAILLAASTAALIGAM